MTRARALAGQTLAEIADRLGHQVPEDTTRAKGWVGQLVEDALGAAAGARAVPDFEALGVELKTVPVDHRGRPREATYVTTLPLQELSDQPFQGSSLQRKLSRVLFVPVEASAELPLSIRRLGTALLWRPSPSDEAELEADWRLFSSLVAAGRVDAIAPDCGQLLQVRPKGADARDTAWATGPGGTRIRTMRRGLYLRPAFVHAVFARTFHMPSAG